MGMSSIPASTALTDQKAAHEALEAADNALFIADADRQILAAIALGRADISMTTFGHVSPHGIWKYYSNLGYNINFPDLIQGQAFQPVDLFGEFWINYWNHTLLPPFSKNPVRIVINWGPFIQFFTPPQDEPV
jgi:hypothetical protein